VDPADSTGVVNVSVSTSRFHTGTHSLVATIGVGAYSSGQPASGASVAVPLCVSTGTLNLAGYTFSAWVYFTVDSGFGSIPQYAANMVQAFFAVTDSITRAYNTGSTTAVVGNSNLNQWLPMQGPILQQTASNYLMGISVGFAMADYTSDGFAGKMYIDDVQITPP
jgi:hypothetical protein